MNNSKKTSPEFDEDTYRMTLWLILWEGLINNLSGGFKWDYSDQVKKKYGLSLQGKKDRDNFKIKQLNSSIYHECYCGFVN